MIFRNICLLISSFLTLSMCFSQTFSLSGKVIDEASSNELEGCKIELKELKLFVYSDKDGKFEFHNLAKGSYELNAYAQYFENLNINVLIKETNNSISLLLKREKDLPEITLLQISITGGEKGMKNLPGSAYYLSPKELQKFNYTDPNRLLKTVPGVNIQEEDGFGLRPNIGIRGSGVDRSSKITIMEDGILAAPAPYSAPAAYYFPTMGRMQAVEILKGSSQIKYGPYTTGGAINLISTQLPKAFEAKITAFGGSFWGRNIHTYIGNSHERISYSLESFNYGSNGFKKLDGGGETGFQKSDYLAKLKFKTKESAKVQQSLTLKVGKVIEQSNETYLGLTQDDFTKNPYRRYAASQKDQMNCSQTQMALFHNIQASKWLSITTSAYRNQFQRNWYKLDAVKDSLGVKTSISNVLKTPILYPEQYAILTGQTSAHQDALILKGNNRSYYGQGIQTIFGFNISKKIIVQTIDLGIRYHQDGVDRFQNEDAYQMSNSNMFQTSDGVMGRESNRIGFASALATYIQYKITWKKWILVAGLRNENIRIEEKDYGKNDPNRTASDLIVKSNKVNVLIPGMALDLKLNDFLSFFTGIHKGFAPPSVQLNSKAEESVNIEIGAKFDKKAFSGQLVTYYNAYENLLGADLAASGGSGNGELYNGGKAKAQGIELLSSYDFATFFTNKIKMPVTLGYTYTDARFLSNFNSTFEDWGTVNYGDHLPYLSIHQINLALSVDHSKFSINLNAKYNSAMRSNAGQGTIDMTSIIPAYLILDASVKYNATKNIAICGSINNLSNEVYLVSIRPAGLRPGMPRVIQIGLKATIN